MGRQVSDRHAWEYWIPGWGQALLTKDLFTGNLGKGISRSFGGTGKQPGIIGAITGETAAQAQFENQMALQKDAQQFTAEQNAMDRDFASSAYQRGVSDLQAAGLNPWMLGSSAAGVGTAGTANSVGVGSAAQANNQTGTALMATAITASAMIKIAQTLLRKGV